MFKMIRSSYNEYNENMFMNKRDGQTKNGTFWQWLDHVTNWNLNQH